MSAVTQLVVSKFKEIFFLCTFRGIVLLKYYFFQFTTNVVTALSQRCDGVVNKVMSLKRITLLFPREMIGSNFLFDGVIVALFLLYVVVSFHAGGSDKE